MKNRFVRYTGATLALCLLVPAILSAQSTGTIVGSVSDAEDGEMLVGVTVKVLDTPRGAATDVDGKFRIDGVPSGTHTIVFEYATYVSDTVEGVEIKAGQTLTHEASLRETGAAVEIGGVTAYGKRSQKSTEGALDARKQARQVTEVMSSEEISASGASDAGDAVKRQTGVSVVGGKSIVVRGLSERYNNTSLDGDKIASPEPEKKSVPFDLFPSGMIENITTIKTFTPDNPGDFAGALVKISTKDFPRDLIFDVGVGTSFNSETQGADALGYSGSATDWLGLDDGTRALPEDVRFGRNYTPEGQANLLEKFDNTVWRPQEETLPMNSSFNLTVGNSFGQEKPIGFLLSTSYSNGYSYQNGIERHPKLEVTEDGSRALRYDYNTQEATQSVLWGGLLNLSLGLGDDDKIGVKGVLNHSADDKSVLVEGDFNSSTTGIVRRTLLRYVERTIATGQLIGEHTTDILTRDSKVEWRAGIALSSRSEPDNRQTSYLAVDEDDALKYNGNFGSGNGRFYSNLTDVKYSGGFDWTAPLYFGEDVDTDTRLKFGAYSSMRTREFSARRFLFSPGTKFDADVLALDPEALFAPEYVQQGFISFDNATLGTDAYEAEEIVAAGYGMIETPVFDRLRLVGGARVEVWSLDLIPINQNNDLKIENLRAGENLIDVLPSVNLIYGLAPDMNVRAAFSQTLARPEFREIAPFRFDDYKQSTYGNPSLERTRILNYDARWEWFPRPGELIAVSGFYKNFTNPIEQFYLLGASDIQVEPVNATGASTYGAEIELRKALDQISHALEDFSVGLNLTLVNSAVSFQQDSVVSVFNGFEVTETPVSSLTNLERPLQGQSPYLVNAMLGYGNSDLGTDVTVLFNVFGERLAVVGTNGTPDVYEQPRPTLDMTWKQRLWSGLKLSVKAMNLLDSETSFTQEFSGPNPETIDRERYFSGRSLSVGFSFSLDQLRLHNATR